MTRVIIASPASLVDLGPVLSILCFLFGCSLRQSIRDHEPSPTSGEAESTIYVDVDRMDIGGTSVSLYDFAGQVLVDEGAPSHRDVADHERSSSGRVLVRVRSGPWRTAFVSVMAANLTFPLEGRP